jgi:hypothetical protein
MTKIEEYMVKGVQPEIVTNRSLWFPPTVPVCKMNKDGRKKLTLKEKYKIIFDRLFPKLFAKVYPFKFQDFKLTE